MYKKLSCNMPRAFARRCLQEFYWHQRLCRSAKSIKSNTAGDNIIKLVKTAKYKSNNFCQKACDCVRDIVCSSPIHMQNAILVPLCNGRFSLVLQRHNQNKRGYNEI